jgi:hypothetical protein
MENSISRRHALKTLGALALLPGCTDDLENVIYNAQGLPIRNPPERAEQGFYNIETLDNPLQNATEYRLFHEDHHFGTILDQNPGRIIFRPHPGNDPNGWGTSWYLQTYLQNSSLRNSFINSISHNDHGIRLSLNGEVSNNGNSYGDTFSKYSFHFNPEEQLVFGKGRHLVELNGPLNESNRDMFIFRLATNYMIDVPQNSGENGNTGDMEKVVYNRGSQDFAWIPNMNPFTPGHFPNDVSNFLSIEVVGDYNDVLFNPPLEPAFKPTLKVATSIDVPYIPMIFGGWYYQNQSQSPYADNVNTFPVVKKSSNEDYFLFDFDFESYPIDEKP